MLSLTAMVAVSVSLGGLLSESLPRGVHLLDTRAVALTEGVEGAESAEGGSPAAGNEAAPETSASLRAQIGSLVDSRPSLGGPISMLAVGGVLALSGISVALMGAMYVTTVAAALGSYFTQLGIAFLIVGIGGFVVGVPLAVVGAVLTSRAIQKRKANRRELNELNRRLRRLEGPGASSAPLPPGPMVRDDAPEPAVLLATF